MKRFALPLLGLLAAAGCSRESGQRTAPAEPVYTRHYRQASALAMVSCSETNIPFSGSLRLAIELHAPPGDAVVFPELESMELAEIAQACDCSVSTVKRRLAQARKTFERLAKKDPILRDWLEDEN